MLASVSHLDEAMRIAEHLRAALADLPIVPVGTVSASFGVTLLAANETQEQALERADRALYAAKNQGRNRVIAG
jgi:diguanylate cyclase (GGDEF)-like protein